MLGGALLPDLPLLPPEAGGFLEQRTFASLVGFEVGFSGVFF